MVSRRWVAGTLGAALLVSSLVGCLGVKEPAKVESAQTEFSALTIGRSHSVVAVLDTGINPYHPLFRWAEALEPKDVLPDLPPYETVPLSFDLHYGAALEKDGLSDLRRDQLYWFEGTRILAFSHDEQSADYAMATIDENGHGTAVSSLVVRANPNAFILAVETFADDEQVFPWLVQQSWIEVVSISKGLLGNLPVELIDPEGREISEGLSGMVVNGKLIVTAAGNEPTPTLGSPYSGAPWVIAVGGVSSETHGERATAAKTPSLVSENFVSAAAHETTSDEWTEWSGTSFGTPIVAGVVSRAIYEVREAWGYTGNIQDGALAINGDKRLTNADVRLALNRTAVYWETTDHNPELDTSCTLCPVGRATLPILPTPWVQMGWGFVNESIVPDLVAVLLGEKPLPDKPAEAIAYMDAVYTVREEYWNLPRPR